MTLFLNQEEIYDLTHKRIPSAQRRAVKKMGIQHKVRPDGTVAVLKEHVKKEFDGLDQPDKVERAEPNWAAI